MKRPRPAGVSTTIFPSVANETKGEPLSRSLYKAGGRRVAFVSVLADQSRSVIPFRLIVIRNEQVLTLSSGVIL